MKKIVFLLALAMMACGQDSGTQPVEPGVTAPMPSSSVPPAPASDSSATAGQPTATPAGSGQPAAQPAAAAPEMAGTAQPAAGGPAPAAEPGATPPGAAPTTDGAPEAEVVEAAPADDCNDWQVSYSKPCHGDPNPCGIDSGFPGDEYCILPPAPGEGFQIHIGPDDYEDAAQIAEYVIEPGEEFNNSVLGHIPVTEERAWFNHWTVSMRPGSHHWISRVVDGKPEERFYNDTGCGGATAVGSIGGGQNLVLDNPPKGIHAPENEGLGRSLPGDSSLCMNLHAYNVSEGRQLREMWINIYTVDESEVTQRARGIGVVGGLGMAVRPGASEEITYTETFNGDGRIIQLFGHRHAWTPRFAVWLNDDLIYDSWDWYESITFDYNTNVMNPPINTEGKVDGAVSGIVDFKAGDKLKFSCFVENKSDITLRFANSLYGGEMCNLWGSAVGAGLSGFRF
ncbi:MAG: hypothetical protein OXU20_14155 [Myxococcales bacterium]|nr:hypothetical protein [Myxococcales bacterium]MDD9968562.1 hypothetical protein [Myxococcales bacterium]